MFCVTKARECVEVNASQAAPSAIVVDAGGISHTVEVVYDEYPKYCNFFLKLGHQITDCFKKNPSLKPGGNATVFNNVGTEGENTTVEKESLPKDNHGFQPVIKKNKRARASFNVFGQLTNRARMDRIPPHPGRTHANNIAQPTVVAGAAGQVEEVGNNASEESSSYVSENNHFSPLEQECVESPIAAFNSSLSNGGARNSLSLNGEEINDGSEANNSDGHTTTNSEAEVDIGEESD